ncbi:HTH-type transcriptional regulator / antitoxin HigA [Stigmatella aurantiaca]|uniref:HTH-type transcriptional regulator / antitoxin HigA n=2 Tax=Stigmatella aurantiaca TaxID=41 RepID=A0A1H7XHJ7_STIAU|nr:HTH-type transcriptional regulator / antitoxin HigA [Stigmatella aurantiaca]
MLGEVFGVAAEKFMELQKSYELYQARGVVQADPHLARRASLFGALPVGEMIKRRWIDADDVKQVARVESEIARFFGVQTPSEIPVLPHAAKKTDVDGPVAPAQMAWLFRVKHLAREMVVDRYSSESCREAIKALSGLLSAPEEARHVPRILSEAGIRFVLVESLPKAKIDGACLWLGETAPVIGMSLRFDRIDNFWFVLRHELEHVLRQHGRIEPIIDTDIEAAGQDVPEEERQANEAASAFCVPKKELDSFIARKQPVFAERDILGFAARLRLHPGLVAGQLRYRLKRWDLFAKHLVKIRYAVSPGAVVDGWGDVAPVGH